ncbi:MAG: TonB-dependent receptor [bacterium]
MSFFLVFAFLVSISAQDTENLMDMSLEDILNMEVTTASKTSQKISEAPSIVSVITANEIKNMGARDIVDVLRTVAGIDLALDKPALPGNEMTIRGLTNNNKVKIMINGHSLSVSNTEVDEIFDIIPIACIKQIEIIRGPGSALYGAGAFTGVVNIITKNGKSKATGISLTGGSYNTMLSQAEYSYQHHEFDSYVYADYYQTDGFDGIIEQDYAPFDNPLLPFSGSAAPGKMTSDSKYYSALVNVEYKNLLFHSYFGRRISNLPVGPALALTDENSYELLYTYGDLTYKLPITGKGEVQFRTYYNYSDIHIDLEVFPEETAELLDVFARLGMSAGGFPEGEGLSSAVELNTMNVGAEISANYQISDGIEYPAMNPMEDQLWQYFHTGMTDITNQASPTIDANRSIFALYAQGSIDLKQLLSLEKGVNSLSFVTGVRYDHYSDVGSSTNPRAGLVYAPAEKLYFKVLYGQAFRAPAYDELYISNNFVMLGNPDLKPEKISTTEGLIGFDFTRNIRSSVTFFNVNAKDLIQLLPSPIPGNPALFSNIGSIVSKGIEAELKIGFDLQKYAYANATWQSVKNTTRETILSAEGQSYTHPDLNPGNIPEIYGNIGVNYDISKYLIANASVNYVGEKKRSELKTWTDETLVTIDQRDPIKARTLLNTSLTFRNIIKGFELQISGFNLLDADHRDPEPEGKIVNDYPRPGRSFRGRLSYSL